MRQRDVIYVSIKTRTAKHAGLQTKVSTQVGFLCSEQAGTQVLIFKVYRAYSSTACIQMRLIPQRKSSGEYAKLVSFDLPPISYAGALARRASFLTRAPPVAF